jgi:tetratricopeptide (TPR) repeat protein
VLSRRVIWLTCTALAASGTVADAGTLSAQERREAVKAIRSHLAARRFDAALKVAQAAEKDAPNEPRFLYLQAEVLTAFERDADARRLRERARALNPDDESPHYSAADLLQELGRRSLAVHEWLAILDIPPDGQTYDANARLRLGGIYETCGRFAEAADMYEEGVKIFEAGRQAGHGLGLVGATPDRLKARAAALRRKAAAAGADHRPPITDRLDDLHLSFGIAIIVKEDKLEELRRALGSVEQTLSLDVQPAGFRLFDVTPASLMYDAAKEQILVTLNGARCCKPTAYKPESAKPRIAVRQLDCVYIFELDAKTGAGKTVARYEKDYRLTARAGLKLQAAKLTVTINDKNVAWGDLLDGHTFDTLPEKLAVRIEGTRRSGKAVEFAINLVPEQPPVKPLPAGNK